LPYVLLFTKTRIGSPALPKLAPGLPTQTIYRSMTFNGSTSDTVVIYVPADGCLRVLDPLYGTARTVPGLSYQLTDAIPLSNTSRIESGSAAAVPPVQYFGAGNTNSWCYFYEKAELARQLGDWQTVDKLFKQASAKGFTALLPAENLVFIESAARAGELPAAVRLTASMLKQQPELCPAVREIWERVSQNQPSAPNELTKLLDGTPACK
jgi:hypothetical protein